MKKGSKRRVLFAFLLVLLFGSMAGNALAAIADNVVISEVQVVGGTANDEFVELYNPTANQVDLSTWSIQYKSGGSPTYQKKNFENGNTLLTHAYFLITHSSYDGDVTANMSHSTFSLSGTGGTIFLVNDQNLLTNSNSVSIIDKVAYGSGDLFPEKNETPTPPADQSIERISSLTHNENEGNGWDTNNNSADFIIRTTSQPQNSNNATEWDINDPVFNLWVNPFANNTNKSNVLNITVNITDAMLSVNQVLVNFNNTNFSMTNLSDLWYYEWDTTKNTDGKYNITVYYNDTAGNRNSTAIYNITIDNTPPSVSSFNGVVINNANLSGIVILNVTITDATTNVPFVYFNITNSNGDMVKEVNASNVADSFWNASIDTSTLTDGIHSISVFANDTLGNINKSETINVTIDNIKPYFINFTGEVLNFSYFNGGVKTINVTANDSLSGIKSVKFLLINSSGNNIQNYTAANNELSWYNSSLNISSLNDGFYNITAYAADYAGNINDRFNITIIVDKTFPQFQNATLTTNARNYIDTYANISASINATDVNLQNVTCRLSDGTTAPALNITPNAYDIFNCSGLKAATDGDFVLYFDMLDKAGNLNTSVGLNFTTKHSTTASFSANDITVSGLNQSDKIVEVSATLTNDGSSPIYHAGIIIDSFSTDSSTNYFSPTSISYTNCSQNINNSQSCSVTFNITIAGGTPPDPVVPYKIIWDANWTNNNFTEISFKGQDLFLPRNTITIESNPQITTVKNRSTTISHGENSTLEIFINSTGNSNLENVITAFVGDTLTDSYVTLDPSTFTSISAAVNKSFNATIKIPKHTSPGNYTGTLYVNASNAENKTILLTIEVPEDNSWTTSPTNVTIYKRTEHAGLTTTISLNNSGNIGQKYSISSAGDFKSYIWNTSNPTSIYVEKDTIGKVNIYHIANGPNVTSPLTLTFTSLNTSVVNKTYITLIRDDNNPTINITNPINNSFVSGIVEFNVSASDLNLSNIEFYINNNLVFNDREINKSFNWNTTNGNYPDEIYTLKAIAYDSAGNSNLSSLSVTVNNTDDNPVNINDIPTINIIEDNDSTSLNLSLYFKTLDGDSLKYNFTQPDNVTVQVNNATQIANFTPAANFSGLNYIIFTAIDSSLKTTSSNNITINVTNVNDAPTAPIQSSPADTATVFSATGKVTLNWTQSTDPDGDTITYHVFYDNNTDVNLTTNTQNTYITLDNLNNGTIYYWKVYATDGTDNSLNSSKFQFTVTVDDAPTISSYTPLSLTPSVAENSTLEFNITATDPDGGELNYTWYVDSILNKTDGYNFSYTPNFTAAGNHIIIVDVTDNNSNSVSNTWTVTVTNTNREPVLDAISTQSVDEDSTLEFNITATDPDGDSLTFTSNITSILFTNAANNSMATVSWTPTNDYVGGNMITFTVNDSSKTDSQIAPISVANTNDLPIITSFFPIENKTIAAVVGIQEFNITFIDVDTSDALTALWFRNGTQIFASNPTGGNITNLTKGIYNITVIPMDNSGGEARHEWILTVTTGIIFDGLTSPILVGLNQSQRENVTDVVINHAAFGNIDFGSKTMNFSRIANLEDAVSISLGSISIDTDTYPELKNKSASVVMKGLNYTKAPLIYKAEGFKNAQNGELCNNETCTGITYDVANGILGFSAANFSTYYIQTNTTNGAPVITSTPITKAIENAQYAYDVDAADPDGDSLIFSLITSPAGMSINSGTGVISWKPISAQLGLNTVTVNVSDSNLTTNQSFNIIVEKGPKLIISDLDIKVDSKTHKNVQNNTRISKEAAPGSQVEFKLEIENLFTDDEDLEIEDIDVEITIEGIDDGDDLDENADGFDIKQGKNEDISIDFDIPLEVEEDIYNVIINIEGEDENRTTHAIRWELGLEIEKESHEIRIIRSALTPSTIVCQRQISINTEIINTGTKDEDDVALEITSPDLSISSLTEDIVLDEGTDDNRFAKLVTPSISADVAPGVYPIAINTYYDGKLSETKTVDLTVQECELTKEIKKEVKEIKPKVEVIMPPVTMEKKPVAEVSFAGTDESNTLLAILIVLFLGTAVFVIGAGYIVLRK